MKMRLTKRGVDSIKPQDKVFVAWDADLPNYGLKVTPRGKKVYIAQYRHQGRRRRYTIGEHGPVTPDQARSRAQAILGRAANGEDPAGVKAQTKKALTIADLAARFLEEHASVKKKARSTAEDRRLLNKHILPALGGLKVQAVSRADVAKLHHRLKATPYQANRVLALVSKLFNMAERWGLRPDATNPARHVEKFKEAKRERFLSGEELARLGKVLADAEAEGSESPHVTAAIRLLLFTGARRGEILGLRWSDVDFAGAKLNLPDSKTGKKTVYLNEPALKVLDSIPRLEDNPHVVVGNRPGAALVNLSKPWGRIRSRAGLEDVRLHDLRHSYASVAAASGMGLPIIGSLLGHTQPATTARYSHLSADPQRAAAEKIGREIAEAMAQEPAPKVVNLDDRRKK